MTRGHSLVSLLSVAAVAFNLIAACGGHTAATGGGSSSSSGGDGDGFSGTPVNCTQSMGGGSSSGDAGCTATSLGTCDDGTEFNVSCTCPAGTCTCSKQTSSSGTATKTISTACPEACDIEDPASVIAACGFTTGGAATPAQDAGLPPCTIPTEMQPPSQTHAWSVGRALLDCKSAGLSTICLSNDGTTCPNDPGTVGATCTDECAPDEYVVEFGGPPIIEDDAGWLSPPSISSCHVNGGFPSGTETECCACQ
jgi:hypothetical protein